ncbi:hypothetical protein GGH19_002865 [Coemansia sp. RSA 1807]|nr:hypothetical protein GGH19_002865 [Coemansia sp. RSA 1807]
MGPTASRVVPARTDNSEYSNSTDNSTDNDSTSDSGQTSGSELDSNENDDSVKEVEKSEQGELNESEQGESIESEQEELGAEKHTNGNDTADRRLEADYSSHTDQPTSPARADDSADEGDEEFVQSESDGNTTEQQLSDENTTELQQSDSDDGLELRRRRISTRLRDNKGSSEQTESRGLRRLRRGRRETIATSRQRTSQELEQGSCDSQTGYASSPSGTRRLRRGHADNMHSPLAGRRNVSDSVRLPLAGRRSGFDNSSTEGAVNNITPHVVQQSPTQTRRKVAPSLVAALADPGTESATTEPDGPVSPPPVIDKPREERSYKEFFPDLNVHMPLAVQFTGVEPSELDAQLVKLARSDEGLSTPVSSGGEAERPATTSRTPSSLSIKLVFSDPGSAPALPPPPPLRTGKSAQSYAGTPQSSVVVLAPKRPVVALPETRFRRLDVSTSSKPFVRPEGHYIRNVELTEKDLAERVEYDLDDVDCEWLKRVNAERVEQGLAEVSAKILEGILDNIEKEWFDLVKDVQRAISAQQQEQLPAEESACAICGEEECDNTNAIVFCDGCNLAVHQDCYGVPYIPEGQWLCRRCMLSPDHDVTCVLCPQRGGALKKTTTNKWAHVLCALWIPEVGIANTVYMEPIDSIDQIPRSRWRLSCHLCHRRAGACIQCTHRQCFTAFHATCARRAHLAMSVKPDRRTGDPVFRAYCERHTPASHTQPVDLQAPLKLGPAHRPLQLADNAQWPPLPATVLAQPDARDLQQRAAADDDDASLQLTARVFNAARPVLNEFVFSRVAERIPNYRLGLLQRARLVSMVARYWALKRSMRHGAPLLKRLHLEPWTASVTQQHAHDMAEEQRQSVVRRIRTDLERVRLLTESVRRREREKLRRARLQVEYLRRIVDPLTPILLPVLDELIQKRDPRGVLGRPVTEAEAPDYFEIVKQPMDFGTMRTTAATGGYLSVDDFERDLLLVVANCMTYNQPGTYYFQLAARVKRHIERLVAEVRREVSRLPIDPTTGCLQVAISPEIFTFNLDVPPMPEILDAMSDHEQHPNSDQKLVQEPESIAEAAEESNQEPETAAKEEPSQQTVATPVAEPRVTRSRQQQQQQNAEKQPEKVEKRPDKQPEKADKQPEKAEKQPEKQPEKRQLTLFEQLSVPPPDVRKSLRGWFALYHSDEVMPDSDIPDDINVLGQRLRSSPAKRKAPDAPDEPHKRVRTTIPTGTAVWAKMESYPWFPAETRSPNDSDVPESVAGGGHREEATLLVRFFGSSAAQWRWVTPKQVCPLGVDPKTDQNLFRARKARSSNMVRSIRVAYAEACTAKNIQPLATLD